jgi:hypothetical protein
MKNLANKMIITVALALFNYNSLHAESFKITSELNCDGGFFKKNGVNLNLYNLKKLDRLTSNYKKLADYHLSKIESLRTSKNQSMLSYHLRKYRKNQQILKRIDKCQELSTLNYTNSYNQANGYTVTLLSDMASIDNVYINDKNEILALTSDYFGDYNNFIFYQTDNLRVDLNQSSNFAGYKILDFNQQGDYLLINGTDSLITSNINGNYKTYNARPDTSRRLSKLDRFGNAYIMKEFGSSKEVELIKSNGESEIINLSGKLLDKLRKEFKYDQALTIENEYFSSLGASVLTENGVIYSDYYYYLDLKDSLEKRSRFVKTGIFKYQNGQISFNDQSTCTELNYDKFCKHSYHVYAVSAEGLLYAKDLKSDYDNDYLIAEGALSKLQVNSYSHNFYKDLPIVSKNAVLIRDIENGYYLLSENSAFAISELLTDIPKFDLIRINDINSCGAMVGTISFNDGKKFGHNRLVKIVPASCM